ncbi:MAG: peptidase M14 [Planctomycetes bacterium]|nr:peptidase M14 [Planctomycetota bacterium]MBL7143532.1 peptidase M14 [Phycisphaerae bacterium]
MKHRSKIRTYIVFFVSLYLVVTLNVKADAQKVNRKPKASNPADHSFPALGASDERKVEVAWNRFYDHAGMGGILARLHKAFPELTRLYSIGKSVQGRDIWCIEVTSHNVGDSDRKPGMYIDGNIHGNEVQGGEVVAYTAWYLCHQYGRLEKVTALLDRCVFYLVPTINPDARDFWFHAAYSSRSSRTGLEPTDDDRDGLMDEDDYDDLDGDGVITQMRIKDLFGRYKPHPNYPDYLMVRVNPDERGQYSLLGGEGIDNDGDGRINEDRRGGYDMNRNWAFDWQPNYVQYGAKEYPFSQPETRAVADFVLSRPNIAAAHSYHNSGGLILRGPGREGGEMSEQDERALRLISERGEKILPYYRSIAIWDDLYTVWGGELDWFYGGRGILTFSNELWTSKNLYKTPDAPSDEQQAEFVEYVLMGDGLIPWREYDHPTYGKIEIGGRRKEWGRIPPSFLLEEELHRNMAFTLYHADMMPLLKIHEIAVEKLEENLYKIWVTIENQRLIPTRTGQDITHHISPPDIVSLKGNDIKVLSAGRVTDKYFKRVQPVKRRPERVELNSIGGMDSAIVQFVAEGKGSFTITVDSAKGGVLTKNQLLP